MIVFSPSCLLACSLWLRRHPLLLLSPHLICYACSLPSAALETFGDHHLLRSSAACSSTASQYLLRFLCTDY